MQAHMAQHEQLLKQKEEQLTKHFEALKQAHKDEESKLATKIVDVEKSRDKFRDQCNEFAQVLKKMEQTVESKHAEYQQLQVKAKAIEEENKIAQHALDEIKAENASLNDAIKTIKVELKSAKAKKGTYDACL